jgi:hypothetical protein
MLQRDESNSKDRTWLEKCGLGPTLRPQPSHKHDISDHFGDLTRRDSGICYDPEVGIIGVKIMKLNTDRVALIAGSTGIVGRNLAALLLEQGWNVTAQMFLQTSGDVAVLGECRLIESFTSPVEMPGIYIS